MPTTHIRTFLAKACRDSIAVVDEYSKYGRKGGYNYWRSLDAATLNSTVGGQTYDQAVGECNSIAKPDERAANQKALKRFNGWRVKQSGEWFPAPTGILEGPKGILRVNVAPNFLHVVGSKRTIVLLWPYERHVLRQKLAGIGVFAMQQVLGVGDYSDCEFCIHDVSKDSAKPIRYKHGSIPKNARSLLAHLLEEHERAYELTHAA